MTTLQKAVQQTVVQEANIAGDEQSSGNFRSDGLVSVTVSADNSRTVRVTHSYTVERKLISLHFNFAVLTFRKFTAF